MNIKSAKYMTNIVTGENSCINIIVSENDGDREISVPLDPDNMHYAEILKQVADGDLTIADAD